MSLLNKYLKDKQRLNKIIIGIRPEYIKIHENKTKSAIRCKVLHKVLTLGKQYLVYLELNNVKFKAKTKNEIGKKLQNEAWIELPEERIMLFNDEGIRISS